MTPVVLFTLVLTLQVPTPVTQTPTPVATPAVRPATQSSSTATGKPGALSLTVRSEQGDALAGVVIAAHGAVDRGGVTGSDGLVTLQNMPAGTYRCRVTRDGFVMLDKEVTIRAGARTTAEAVLSAAPPPPPPAPPEETRPAAGAGPVGTPRVLSIADLAEQMLKESQPTVERLVGCSGVAASRVITTKENIAPHRHADADEMIYVVAGEATLTIAQADQVVVAGWFGLVPRGTAHSLTRRGRSPLVVLSVQSGQGCGSGDDR